MFSPDNNYSLIGGVLVLQGFNYDLTIHDSRKTPIAFIELKNQVNMDENLADEFRKNIMLNNGYISAPYFLLLSQKVGFLWKDINKNLEELPTIVFNMIEVIKRYKPDEENYWFKKLELENIVYIWLLELSLLREFPENSAEEELAKVDFLQTIKGASVRFGEIM